MFPAKGRKQISDEELKETKLNENINEKGSIIQYLRFMILNQEANYKLMVIKMYLILHGDVTEKIW